MKRILLCLCHMSGKEMDFINEAFADDWVVPLGPNVNGFEEDLKKYLDHTEAGATLHKEVCALASGTAALHLGLIALGVKAGDEVIVQSMTFSASANPVAYCGATPVFVDSESETWNMDPALLDEAIKDRISKTGKAPKAIIPVDLYGMPAKMDEILEIADRYGIPVLEDAAEALGSEYKGRKCGTFGRFAALSFNGNKMITTSGGGAIVCPDKEARDEVLFYATQSRENYPFYQHEHIGFNYRMSNISAGIGRGQMTILEEHIAHHRKIHGYYKEAFKGVEGITLQCNPSPDFNANFWLCNILLDKDLRVKPFTEDVKNVAVTAGLRPRNESISVEWPNGNVENLRKHLAAAGVESRPLWKPMHTQPVFADAPYYGGDVALNLFRRGLCIPAGPHVTLEDARFVVDTIFSVIENG